MDDTLMKFKKMFALLLLAMGLIVANAAEALKIGQSYQGGIIFFVDVGGQHGLIAAKTDQSSGIPWYNGTYFTTNARADGLYAGTSNTNLIISTQTTVGLACSETSPPAYCTANENTAPAPTGNYAALVAANYSIQGDGATPCKGIPPEKCYGDWYLPSMYELNLMHKNIGQGAKKPNTNKGGFANSFYWSSAENESFNAWNQNFGNGLQDNYSKEWVLPVRAVRSF
jgi:hypothetical protein